MPTTARSPAVWWRVQIRGAELHVQAVGTGPPIVFSHGLLWSAEMFAPQIEALAERYRCIAYDHRGQGRSEAPGRGSISIEELYQDAVALIEHLDVGPVHFVGLSMGGFVGMRIAARRPDLVRSLVLLATSCDREPRAKLVRYAILTAGLQLGLGPWLGAAVAPVMLGRTFRRDPGRAAQRERLVAELRGLDRSVARAVYGVLQREGVRHELNAIRAPTLVIHGEEDRAIPLPRAIAMQQAIAGATLRVIAGAGHTCTLEAPAAVTEAIARFLDGPPTAP